MPTDGQGLDQSTRPVESRHIDRYWIRGHALWKSRHMDRNWIRGEALWKAGTWTGIGSELTLQTYPETQIQRVIGAKLQSNNNCTSNKATHVLTGSVRHLEGDGIEIGIGIDIF